jgi:RNA polymerase primary sigma factor
LRELKIAQDKITRRTENTNRYFVEVERHAILSPDEEFRIGRLAQEGDEKAINTLIKANLRFVVSVAKQYSNANMSLDDLISQGNIGLCDAARTFDPTRGFKFISYAVWHIRKEILLYLTHHHRIVRLPQNIVNDISKIKKANETILQLEGRPGTDAEISEILDEWGADVSYDKVVRIRRAEVVAVPIDTTDVEDTKSPIEWLESDPLVKDSLANDDSEAMVKVLMSSLDQVSRDVVLRKAGFGIPEAESFAVIASRYGKTTEWARQTHQKAIRRLKSRLNRLGKFENYLNQRHYLGKIELNKKTIVRRTKKDNEEAIAEIKKAGKVRIDILKN